MNIKSVLAQAGLDRDEKTGAISTPVYHSSTFRHPELGKSTGYDYSRTANPTRKVLEDLITHLEEGDKGYAFASGMAALTAVASLFSSGDHIVISDDLYGGTYRLFDQIFSRFGISSSYADMSSLESVEKALTPATKALLIETPTNPLMKITDISAIATRAKKRGILVIVDNTFMTPYLMKPITLGADIVVHSGTKYLAGHNDVVCGFAVAKDPELCERIGFIQNSTGGVLSPNDSWLVIRGLKTLSVRLDRSEENALRIAEYLTRLTEVTQVYYPGLSSHNGHDVHVRQSRGFGSMISFRLRDASKVEKVINNVKLISFAESLGGVESLITYPAVQTHGAIPPEVREKIGVTDDLLRLSIGIEDADDLMADLHQAIQGR